MFEKSVIVRCYDSNSGEFDLGLLAETLLFYKKIHIVFDIISLSKLIKMIGVDNFVYLIEKEYLTASFTRGTLANLSSSERGITTNHFDLVEISWKKNKRMTNSELIRKGFEIQNSMSSHISQSARKISKLVPSENIDLGSDATMNIIEMAHEDLRDAKYVNEAAKFLIQNHVSEFDMPSDWDFRLHETGGRFIVDTNIDFDKLNRLYFPNTGFKLTSRMLLSSLLDTRVDLSFSAKYDSDLVTTSTFSELKNFKFSSILSGRVKNIDEIELFQRVHLQTHSLREVINSGERKFDEFIKILDEAQKFKQWLEGVDPEIGLLREYYVSATENNWVGKLPGKTTRFSIFNGLGFMAEVFAPSGIALTSALALSAADTFLLDKLLQGWRPSHFVEGSLDSFVKTEN